MTRPLADRRRDLEKWIYYFGLGEWWTSNFSDEETQRLAQYFLNPYPSAAVLEDYEEGITSQTPEGFLLSLGFGHLPRMYEIHVKCLEKATQLNSDSSIQFRVLSSRISLEYRRRDEHPGALEQAIRCCEEQVDLAPKAREFLLKDSQFPVPHPGYKQLSIVREKQGRLEEALRLVEEAGRTGWLGDWDCRAERIRKRLERKSSAV